MNKFSSVIIKRREGSVPAATVNYGWELFIDLKSIGLFISKIDAEEYAQKLIYS